jgi:hypothetical protein
MRSSGSAGPTKEGGNALSDRPLSRVTGALATANLAHALSAAASRPLSVALSLSSHS